jgi:HAD superfamily hydrolase (TIGR01509 family)
MTRAAIFDMDGVIIDNEPLQRVVWVNFFHSRNIAISEEQFVQMKGRRSYDVLSNLMPGLSPNEIEELCRERSGLYLKHIKSGFKPVKGIRAFVEELVREGLAIGVATSAHQSALFLLEKVGIKDMCSAIVTGDQVTKGKPDPEIYLKAAALLNVEPSDCLAFEDSKNGVKSAKSAGMRVVALLTSYGRGSFPDAAYEMSDFEQISGKKLLSLLA